MLRGEHVMARNVRGELSPHRLSAKDGRTIEVAGALVETYASHVGRPRSLLSEKLSALEEELGPRLDPRRGFKVARALSKLLEERCGWDAPSAGDPYQIRTRIFELAAGLPELPTAGVGLLLDAPTREDVLSQVARETGYEDAASLMYADRQGAQVLETFEETSPSELVARYNVAQVQGVLYGAKRMRVDLGAGADARLVFRYAKLLGLIYRLETVRGGHRLLLDGPLSLFGGTRKYGLRLAKFLPGLLLTSPWKLHADVSFKGRDAVLELDSDSAGLESHYKSPEDVEGDEVREAFRRAWDRAKEKHGWELQTAAGILPVPALKTALVPDFALRNARSGEEAHLEILGFWSEKHLVERVALVREAAKRGHRVLIAAPESLGTSPETLSAAAHGEIVPFKNRLDAKSVLAALERG